MTGPTSERRPHRGTSLAQTLGPPLLAFLAARVASMVAARMAGVDPLRAASWVRWDSLWYLRIAAGGYRLEPCPGGTSMFCGTTGWFPGYPLLIAAGARLGSSLETAGLLVAALAQLVLLALVWNRLLGRELGLRRWALLVLAAFFPGAIYTQSVFPISTVLVFMLGFLLAVREGRFGLAAFCGAAAALTYPTGCLLAPVYAVWLLVSTREARGDWRRLLPLAGPVLGLGAVLAVMGVQTGAWDAFFRNQVQGFGYGLSDPLTSLGARLVPLLVWKRAGAADLAAASQTLLVLFLVGWAGAEAIRSRADPTTALFGLMLAAYWLFPLVIGGRLSLYRAEALLLPSVWLLRRTPTPALVLIIGGAMALAIPMARAFFQGTLV
ncbi:MAG: hypothetical protein ACXWLP_02675 [Myxococcaceae bacterium]